MMSATKLTAPALALAMLLAGADRSAAQGRYPYDSRVDRAYDIAYDNGYRHGYDEGLKDARRREAYSYADENDFRKADRGYRREFGDKESYRRAFRDGFIHGYSEGFDGRIARTAPSGSYPASRPRAVPRTGPYGPRIPYPTTRGRYPADWRVSPAHEHGFSDGYERGLDDARDGDRYDPVRHGHYRSADHGYKSAYGSRERYKNEFREAFLGGYDAGYRDGQRYGRDSRRGWNRPWWLPF